MAPASADWSQVAPSVLQHYFLTPEELATVGQAVDIVTASCMDKFGFSYPVQPYADAVRNLVESENEAQSRLFGPTDRTAAARYGFMPASLYEGSAATDTPTEQSAAFQKVLFAGHLPGSYGNSPAPSTEQIDGVALPPGGCRGEAVQRVTGTYDGLTSGAGRQFWIQASVRAQASSRWRAIVKDWVACLASAGYHVTDPLRDEGDIKKITDAESEKRASPAQIALALADIDCKQETDLVQRLNAVVNDYSARALAKNHLALTEERTRLEKEIKTATAIVAATGATTP